MGNLEAFLGALGAVLFVFVIFGIAIWCLWGYACMKVLKALDYTNPWMAWIPFLNTFALANCTADEDGNTKIGNWKLPTIVFSFWFVAGWILSYVPSVGSLLNLLLQVACMGTCFSYIYSMCENKEEKDVTTIAVVSGFVPIVALVKFLSYKPDEISANIKAKRKNAESDEYINEVVDDDEELL